MLYNIKHISDSKILFKIFSVFSILCILIISVGQTARWDILEHLQMADRFEVNSTLYPNQNDYYLTGVSVYFPGTAILVVFLKAIFPDFIILFLMQIFACFIIVVFFYIQFYISKTYNIYSSNFYHFFYFTYIFYFFLNFNWFVYALELKPDTLSYCLGALGVIISQIDKKKSKIGFRLIFGAILTGVAIVFKQQYIFFLIGIVAFSFVVGNKMHKSFALISLCVCVTIILLFRLNKNIWFWTVEVLSDDGFISIFQWLKDHFKIFASYLFVGILLVWNYVPNILSKLKKIKVQYYFICIFSNIWTAISIFVFLGALVSSLKVGGNAGNTSFGLVVMGPIFYKATNSIKSKLGIIIFLSALIFSFFNIKDSFEKIYDSYNFKSNVDIIVDSKNEKILCGSDTYYAIRDKRKGLIINYWMYSLKNNSILASELVKLLKLNIFKYLVLENNVNNRIVLKYFPNYKILYSNKIGILAVLEIK